MSIVEGQRVPRQELEKLWEAFILELTGADGLTAPADGWIAAGTRYLEQAIASPDQAVLVARQDDRCVGLAVATLRRPAHGQILVSPPHVHLSDLYVEPAHRNRGRGTALLWEIARWAAEREAGYLHLNVLAGSKAQELYHRLGFRPYQSAMVRPLGDKE